MASAAILPFPIRRPAAPQAGMARLARGRMLRLADAAMPEVAAASAHTRVQPGGAIVCEGEPARHYLHVTQGTLKLNRRDADGRIHVAGFMFVGDFVALAVDETYGYTLTAITPSAVCRYARASIERLLAEFPALPGRLKLVDTQTLTTAHAELTEDGARPEAGRIARFLLMLAEHARAQGQAKDLLALPMSRDDIADYVGLTPDAADAGFDALTADGMIRIGPRLVRIRDVAALRRRAGFAVH